MFIKDYFLNVFIQCIYERESVAKLARMLLESRHGGYPVIRKDAVSGRDVFVGMISRYMSLFIYFVIELILMP